MHGRSAAVMARRVRSTERVHRQATPGARGRPSFAPMWPVAGSLIGLIGLIALDDLFERRPARHTWMVSFALVASIALLMLSAVAVGRLIS